MSKEEEEKRKELNDINREILVELGKLGEVERKISELRMKAVELWKEIDKKLNGD